MSAGERTRVSGAQRPAILGCLGSLLVWALLATGAPVMIAVPEMIATLGHVQVAGHVSEAPPRFPESGWDPTALRLLESGPLLLRHTQVFDIPDPPAPGSAETVSELALLHQRVAAKLPEASHMLMIEEAAAGEFTERFRQNAPISAQLNRCSALLLKTADRDLQYFVLHYKRRFSRPRPTQLSPSLNPRIAVPAHPAYPSGHAAQGRLASLILVRLQPETGVAVLKFGRALGRRREWAGVHYPSDTEAGWMLAEQFLAELMQHPTFNEQFVEAQQCLTQD